MGLRKVHSWGQKSKGLDSLFGSATLLLCKPGHAAWPMSFSFKKKNWRWIFPGSLWKWVKKCQYTCCLGQLGSPVLLVSFPSSLPCFPFYFNLVKRDLMNFVKPACDSGPLPFIVLHKLWSRILWLFWHQADLGPRLWISLSSLNCVWIPEESSVFLGVNSVNFSKSLPQASCWGLGAPSDRPSQHFPWAQQHKATRVVR